jgi:hypothetical protein
VRLDEYLSTHAITSAAVNDFPGYVVGVGLPAGWAPFDGGPGIKLWAWADDPNVDTFCANIVLTMHAIPAAIDPAEVFAMLCDEQAHLLPDSTERGRALGAASDGPGIAGRLAMTIGSEHGLLISESLSRIVTDTTETFIAQLTLTALPDSPVDRADIWLTVGRTESTGDAAGPPPIGYHGSAPAPAEERR